MKQLRAATISLTVLLLILFALGLFYIPKWELANSHAPAAADPTHKPCAHRVYPPESLQAREQGTAWVKYTTGFDGTVVAAEILWSSGYPRLDAASLQHIKTCKFRGGGYSGTLLYKWHLH